MYLTNILILKSFLTKAIILNIILIRWLPIVQLICKLIFVGYVLTKISGGFGYDNRIIKKR